MNESEQFYCIGRTAQVRYWFQLLNVQTLMSRQPTHCSHQVFKLQYVETFPTPLAPRRDNSLLLCYLRTTSVTYCIERTEVVSTFRLIAARAFELCVLCAATGKMRQGDLQETWIILHLESCSMKLYKFALYL